MGFSILIFWKENQCLILCFTSCHILYFSISWNNFFVLSDITLFCPVHVQHCLYHLSLSPPPSAASLITHLLFSSTDFCFWPFNSLLLFHFSKFFTLNFSLFDLACYFTYLSSWFSNLCFHHPFSVMLVLIFSFLSAQRESSWWEFLRMVKL